jgi:Glycosyl hydrolase family 14
VEGVMIDVWWGIVEHAPGKYDFSAYRRLLQKIADSGLKAQVSTVRVAACVECVTRGPTVIK